MSSSSNPDRLKRVIRIVLDSGLMYTVCVIAFFGTTLGQSNAQYGVSDVVVQVIVSDLPSYVQYVKPTFHPARRESRST